LFQRRAGLVRLTIFDGAHSVDVPTSFRWLDSLTNLTFALRGIFPRSGGRILFAVNVDTPENRWVKT
jgi:hypothetical protein